MAATNQRRVSNIGTMIVARRGRESLVTFPSIAAGAGKRDEPEAASGAATIPYPIVKEVNPDPVKASTAEATNFLDFTFSAFLGPVFGLTLQRVSGGEPVTLVTFNLADLIWVGAIVLAFILTFFLRELGAEARRAPLAAPTRAS
jgi:hypothetical protein